MLFSIFAALLMVGQAALTPTTVQLKRTTLTVGENGKTKNFYSAKVRLGQPAQEFDISFDLGGGTMILPSKTCSSKACLDRHRFDKWASDTAEDIQSDGKLVHPGGSPKAAERSGGREKGSLDFLSTDLGSGKAEGNFVRDQICLGEDAEKKPMCFPLAMLLAYDLSDVPFGVEPYDGTIGLSLEGLSVSPAFNFLGAFMQGHEFALRNNFGLHIGGEEGGEITFGGYDVKKLSNPLEWVTVAEPQEGRWQVAISAIRVGNNTLQACRDGKCRAALDYGASLFNVPSQLAAGMEQALESLAVPTGYGDGCQVTVMPDIQLVLQNDVVLNLPAEDYVKQISKAPRTGILSGPAQSCKPQLAQHQFSEASIGDDVFVLGESVLRRYYTFFDADSLQVGFSLSGASKKRSNLPPLLDAGKAKAFLEASDEEEDGKENPVILLVQVKVRRSQGVSSLGRL